MNLSLRQIQYRIKTNKRSEYDIYNILAVPEEQQQQQPPVQLPAGYVRFVNKLQNYSKFDTLSDDVKDDAYQLYKTMCRALGVKRKFNLNFDAGKDNGVNADLFLFTFLEALQATRRKMDKRIKIKITDDDGNFF